MGRSVRLLNVMEKVAMKLDFSSSRVWIFQEKKDFKYPDYSEMNCGFLKSSEWVVICLFAPT